MARIRKFCAYRRLDRPNTRVSKFRKKAFVRITPNPRIVRFDMGNLQGTFSYSVELRVKEQTQMRDNALEAARTTCNKILEAKLGKSAYKFKIRVYPFHIMRENPLAAGAGADRMSTGMKHSFGKPYGLAAQIKKKQTVYEVMVEKVNLGVAKEALKAASRKLTGGFFITVTEKGASEATSAKKKTVEAKAPVKKEEIVEVKEPVAEKKVDTPVEKEVVEEKKEVVAEAPVEAQEVPVKEEKVEAPVAA